MYQKRVKNPRYKPLTRQYLIDLGVDIILDGVSTKDLDTETLKLFYYDYKTLRVVQWSTKYKKWLDKTPIANTKAHDKGILKECTYFQVSLTKPVSYRSINKNGFGVPLHRLVYVWFNDVILPYNENNEKMEICHKERFLDDPVKDSHILNIFYDTAKNNRASRQGAVNQYGLRKKEKYGSDYLKEKISKI